MNVVTECLRQERSVGNGWPQSARAEVAPKKPDRRSSFRFGLAAYTGKSIVLTRVQHKARSVLSIAEDKLYVFYAQRGRVRIRARSYQDTPNLDSLAIRTGQRVTNFID